MRVEGRVENPYDLTFSDLVESPSVTFEAVLECSGNLANGSAVSNGMWEGVPLASLLARARPLPGSACVLLEGADTGRLFEKAAALPYSQIVPLDKCLEPSSVVAFKLNDLALPVRNGFPARALFPGWYGMDSVKWLRRIVVLGLEDRNTSFHESGMFNMYNRVSRTGTADRMARLSSMQVKSAIAWPGDAAKLPTGHHLVWGFAWTGADGVRSVAISVDGGSAWRAAKFEPSASRYGWVKWSYGWDAKPGDYLLMSRAEDRHGNQQPLKRDGARKDQYELNWCSPIHCTVR